MKLQHLSVVIPVFNGEKTLETTVSTVLSQNRDNMDIIIVNDGSTDRTPEICSRLAAENQNIHIITHENHGLCYTRNFGIRFALELDRSGYILFLDADDLWVPEFFDSEVENLLNGSYDLVAFAAVTKRGENEKPLACKPGEYKGGADSIWIHSGSHFSSVFYSCRMFTEFGLCFDEELRYAEDRIFEMQCFYLAQSIVVSDKLFFKYVMNPYSTVHTRKTGLDLFVPIINGWLRCDRDMLKWSTSERGELKGGKVLADIYIMDMLDEHFALGGKRSRIDELFSKDPIYLSVLERKGEFAFLSPNIRYNKYISHPRLYILKQRLKGFFAHTVKNAVKRLLK